MTDRVLNHGEAAEVLKQSRRKFSRRTINLGEVRFTVGVDKNEKVLKIRLPGKWRVEMIRAGKTDNLDTVIVIDKAK
jgi:hypothetical protein